MVLLGSAASAPTPASLLVSSPSQYVHALSHDSSLWHRALQVLCACGVNLLLCAHTVPEPWVQAAAEAGVAVVGGVSDGEARGVCGAAGVAPVAGVAGVLAAGAEGLRRGHVGVCEAGEERVVAGPAGTARHNRGFLMSFGPKVGHATTLLATCWADAC